MRQLITRGSRREVWVERVNAGLTVTWVLTLLLILLMRSLLVGMKDHMKHFLKAYLTLGLLIVILAWLAGGRR